MSGNAEYLCKVFVRCAFLFTSHIGPPFSFETKVIKVGALFLYGIWMKNTPEYEILEEFTQI